MKISGYLQLKKVGKTYPDGYTAVSDINLTINRGEFITLLGPSGCGKTTILKMLAGFEKPTEGKILINDVDIQELPTNKRPTATVFQDYALFPNLTVSENIKFGLKLMREPISAPKGIKEKWAKEKLDATKLSEEKLSDLAKDIAKVEKKINRESADYEKHKEWMSIRNMRWASYEKRVLQIEERKRNFLKNGEILLDKRITKNSTRFDKQFVDLKKWFESKASIDKRVDILKAKLSALQTSYSYWQNFVYLSKETFDKKYTTRPLTKQEIKDRVKAIVEKVGLTGKENKYPAELSGGMQQRVALARAIVIEPEIILLDEPLSALDAKVRQQMQIELKRLHQELGLTFILVTHDQEEALSLSTRVVVMSNGKIQQFDTPNKIYDEPINYWTAGFIGKANFFEAEWVKEDKFKFEGSTLTCYNQDVLNKLAVKGEIRTFLVRPEDINIVPIVKGIIKAKIINIVYKGLMYDIRVKWGEQEIQIETTGKYTVDQNIGLSWNIEDVHFIPKRGNEND